MTRALASGTSFALPPGDGGWRIASGSAELYLITPERRLLIEELRQGASVGCLPEGRLALLLVAGDDCSIDACDAADREGWLARLTRIDAETDAAEAARDDALRARLSQTGMLAGGGGGIAVALAEITQSFGLDPSPDMGGDDWSAVPVRARIAGLRAAKVILEDGWWHDDTGPLLLRRLPDGAPHAALWSRGAYRISGDAVQPEDCEAFAWRLYGPLGDDVSSFWGMARNIAGGLKQEIGSIAAAGLGTALLGMLVPLAAAWIFDDIVPAGAGGLLVAAGIALLLAAIFGSVLATARALAITRVTGRGQTAMAAGVVDRVLRLPARFFKTVSAGDFNQRLEALEGIRQLVTATLLNAGLTLVFALVYLVLLFTYDVRMALTGLALTFVYAAAVILTRFAQVAPLREAAERDGKLAGLTFEILDGVAKLRSANAEPRALARWDKAYALERAAAAKGQRVGNHSMAFSDSWEIITLMGLFATAILLAGADLPPGQFIAFLAAFGIFQSSFTGFCESVMAIQTARPLAERARPILVTEPEAAAGRADPGRLSGDIQASGLSFGYDNAMAPLIDGLSFSVKPGEHLAVVGGSGSGKSTILRLLLGFEKPLTGSLAYDGQELASLDPSRVRSQIGVVLQSSQLFAGSIHENIRGATNASLEECMEAAQRAGLADDLAGFPMGLHTPITEGAGTLSGGQRQRILIARALAGNPPLLFFDEATSALDNATQAIVSRTLDEMQATRITIAHRLSTVRNATRICVLEKGKFVESGSFSELMAANGAFAALARRQLLED